jgi:hypothetical protein
MAQTAVEWAMSQIIRGHFIGFAEEFQIIYDKAKAMEKEQIKDAYLNGTTDMEKHDALIDAEQFYNEYYGKKN